MGWFLKLPQWARLLIALSIAAGMFLGIWAMNSRRQAAEAVWAEGEEKVIWDRSLLPLGVFIDPGWDGHRESVEDAVQAMNTESGCTLMVVVDSLDQANIQVAQEPCVTGNPDHAGCTLRNPTTGLVVIQVGQPGDITQSYLIFFHELTHAMGLAHDGKYAVREDPVFFVPITASNAGAHSVRLEQGALLPGLSDKDKAALRARYCN